MGQSKDEKIDTSENVTPIEASGDSAYQNMANTGGSIGGAPWMEDTTVSRLLRSLSSLITLRPV